MLNILSWNIRQGGGNRRTDIVKALTKFGAEVVVLSEFRNNEAGLYIRRELIKSGYFHQHVGHATKEKNSVLIASKIPFDASHCQNADTNFPAAILKANFDVLSLYGMYLPHKKKHRLFDFLLEELKDSPPAILVGDFNTGKNYIDQKGNSFMYSEYLTRMEDLGYQDAFRRMNGEVKEYSWFSHQGNGYRYDHSYIQSDLLPIVKNCYYLHHWRIEGMSDHSPMVLELA